LFSSQEAPESFFTEGMEPMYMLSVAAGSTGQGWVRALEALACLCTAIPLAVTAAESMPAPVPIRAYETGHSMLLRQAVLPGTRSDDAWRRIRSSAMTDANSTLVSESEQWPAERPMRAIARVPAAARPDDVWQRLREGFALPDLDSPLVSECEQWYAEHPEHLKRVIARSRRYLYHIVEEVEKRGMPAEVALLPMMESALNPMAYSRAHASGLWQFIPSTGRNYNLRQDWWLDSRRDVVASTTAALDYLQFLHELHGDWHLAFASYNAGERSVARAIGKNRAEGLPTDYASLPMPRETRYYVPKLQALKNIVSRPEAFGVTLDPVPNEPYFAAISAPADIDIRLAAELAQIPLAELLALNAGYKRPIIPGSHTLVLPAGRVATFQANLDNHERPLVSWQTYVLKPGDRLDRLAVRHGIALASLKRVNGIAPRARARPGQQLLLPIIGTEAGAAPLPALFRAPAPPKRGETLF
jgi:membrane-bound lytic murein transglycosylase D